MGVRGTMWVWDPRTVPGACGGRCGQLLRDSTFGGLTLPDEEGAVRVA